MRLHAEAACEASARGARRDSERKDRRSVAGGGYRGLRFEPGRKAMSGNWKYQIRVIFRKSSRRPRETIPAIQR